MSTKLVYKLRNSRLATENKNLVFAVLLLVIFVLAAKLLSAEPAQYAHAYTAGENSARKVSSPLLAEKPQLFKKSSDFENKIYTLVGNAPIREMVPFISKRNKKVAAFIVGIAKKESGLGKHSPLKDGKNCYNYWGYKGAAGRGSSAGFACFASAEEAVKIVGNRIEVLVGKNRTTPAAMVHTWKCGTSCVGDPGAPSWVSTVTTVFNKIAS